MTLNNYNFWEGAPISWIHYCIIFALAFIFGIGSLLMFEKYEINKSLIGILYSISAATRFVASFFTLSKPVLDQLKVWFPSPLNFLCLPDWDYCHGWIDCGTCL